MHYNRILFQCDEDHTRRYRMSKGVLRESTFKRMLVWQFAKLSILHLYYVSLDNFRMRFSCRGLLYRFQVVSTITEL